MSEKEAWASHADPELSQGSPGREVSHAPVQGAGAGVCSEPSKKGMH